MIPEAFPLRLLHYGHPGPLIRSLKGRFVPGKMTTAIQLGEMSCGCITVLDGNNRIAMVLHRDPNAVMAALPHDRLLFVRVGEWDEDTIRWWNPNPQTFEFVQRHSAEFHRTRRNRIRFASIEEYEAEIARLDGILRDTPHRCVPMLVGR